MKIDHGRVCIKAQRERLSRKFLQITQEGASYQHGERLTTVNRFLEKVLSQYLLGIETETIHSAIHVQAIPTTQEKQSYVPSSCWFILYHLNTQFLSPTSYDLSHFHLIIYLSAFLLMNTPVSFFEIYNHADPSTFQKKFRLWSWLNYIPLPCRQIARDTSKIYPSSCHCRF